MVADVRTKPLGAVKFHRFVGAMLNLESSAADDDPLQGGLLGLCASRSVTEAVRLPACVHVACKAGAELTDRPCIPTESTYWLWGAIFNKVTTPLSSCEHVLKYSLRLVRS
eukprot:2479129-Rhodomonas_salina.1